MLTDQNRSHRRRALVIAVIAGFLVFILWNTPRISQVALYPLRLFVTFVHEAGHGTAALLTGGEFLAFEVLPSGSGQAITRGGSRLLILPAGYLGAALFGAVLFYLTNTLRQSRSLSVAIGVLLLIFSLLFGRFSLTAFLVGVSFGAVLIAVGWKAGRDLNILVLNVLAIITGLNAVLDLLLLVGNSNIMAGGLRNDAAAFSAEVFPLPGAVWALLWAALAVLMLGFAVWRVLRRESRQ